MDSLEKVAELSTSAPLATPASTALLENYPNPFNPETWIPYRLKSECAPTIQIYDQRGMLIRTLPLGVQKPGDYLSREKAAYWDGRNKRGEKVANGVYFYTLNAGDFTATRKMLLSM